MHPEEFDQLLKHTETPKVSVVIPAYNRAETIGAAIASVLRQSWTNFELLIVDDCSTDTTVAEVGKIRDPRLRLLKHHKNMGAGAARNTGIRNARGDWIAFQDSDDEWLPLKLEKQMVRLETASPDHVAAYCGLIVLGTPFRENENRTRVRYHPPADIRTVEGDLLSALLRYSLVSTQTLVARRNDLIAIGGFDDTLQAVEDWECAIRLAQRGRFAFIDEPLVIQRFSANSLTRATERQRRMRMRIIEKHIASFTDFPEILAYRYYENAGELRRQGSFSEARAFLLKACRLQPTVPRYWAMLSYATVASWLPFARRASQNPS